MKNSLRGALLSGLVFPGLGQVVLKHYVRGFALMVAVLAGLSIIVIKAVRHALAIYENIQLGGGVFDIGTITDAASRSMSAADSLTYNIALIWIIACWILGIIDAYRLGAKRDRRQEV